MDAIAIQDANKIRVAMGLAPLPVPGEDASAGLQFKQSQDDGNESDPNDNISTLEKRQAAAGDNWQRLQDEENAKLDRQARKEAAKKQRDAAQRFAKLEGKGLGDADAGELDTKSWLLQQKKRQKQIEKARKMEEEQLAREQQAEYTSKDLAGLRVAHEMDGFDGGEEQILTLKDAEIGDEDEEDELENADLLARERLQEKLELKKKKPVYDPNEVDESEERSILKHYDEEISGKKRKRFTLNEQGHSVPMEMEDDGNKASKGVKISLDILKDETPISDYYEQSTAKIRKPKKPKKAKTTRQKEVDEDDIIPVEAAAVQPSIYPDAMEVDGAATNSANGTVRRRIVELDDDDLQAQLAQQRRLALKKRKKTNAAELARRIREEDSATPGPLDTTGGDEDDEPGMVIDETTEFVANLQRPKAPEEKSERTSTPAIKEDSADEDEDGDATMAQAMNEVDEEEERMKRESATPAAAPVTSTGFEAEDTLDNGIGASLSMLRKRGLIQDGEGETQNAKDRAREEFLAENRALIAEYDAKSRDQRERDRVSGRFERMSVREREDYGRRQNEQREQYLASLQAEHFKRSYRPDVKLKYTDDFGRDMNQKEAFKHLSHMFHGKGSGKQKTEKRLKKIEDEKKREAMSSLDASQHTGMNSAQGATARKNRQAGVRLQ